MERALSTISAGTRKRRGEGYTRRDEILVAARDLFLRDGYEATTIRRIADVVGVSAPALYLYFKDKDAIMLALCDQTFRSLNEVMDGMEKQQLAPIERLRRCGAAYIRFALEHPRQYWLTFMSGNTPEKIKQRGHKPDTAGLDPEEPGAQGAIAFSRLMGIFRDIENSGYALNYPVDTAAELVWMCLHGLVAAIVNNPEFPWTRRDVLIEGMLEVAVRGVVRTPQ
jgi:AcrR family transcriptional regulator